MFTGIVESMATVVNLEKEGTNLHLWLECDFTDELKIDQSISHNGNLNMAVLPQIKNNGCVAVFINIRRAEHKQIKQYLRRGLKNIRPMT